MRKYFVQKMPTVRQKIGLPYWSPRSPGGLLMWLDASKVSGLNDGDTIQTWEDASGNSNDAAQATEASRPVYKTNILNGRPVIRFDGSNDYMVIGRSIPFPYSLFIVVSRTGAGRAFLETVTSGVKSRSPNTLMSFSDATIQHYNSSGYYKNLGITNQDQFYIVSVVVGIATRSGWLNGVEGFSNQASYSTGTNIYINIGVGYHGYHLGDIAEVLIYNSALSDDNRQKLEQYLSQKYGISIRSAI